jgi:hypothetical protein
MRVLFAIALGLWSTVALAKSPVVPAALPGSLVVNSSTEGAEVYVDGEKVGIVPLAAPVPLKPGDHTIKVQKPGFAPLIDVFKVQKKGQTKIDVELTPVSGVLKVNGDVEKARVLVDGKFVCEVPCTTEVEVGARAVQVSKGGYKDFFQNISAVAGQEVALEVKLEELPVGLNPYKPPPPPPPKWYEKWWVWTVGVAAAGVVCVVIAVPVTQAQRDPIKDFNPTYTWTLGGR